MLKRAAFALCLGLAPAVAQGPVVLQRGVLNTVTLEPAPSRVAPGDILILRGLNLGPVDGSTAGVQVFIANALARIFSAAPDQVRVQVPKDAPNGLVNVVVQRGEQRSRPAVVRVVANAVGARTKNELGFGEAGTVDGKRLLLSMTGLGAVEPGPVRAHVGGLPATAMASPSETRSGEFDVAIDLPEGAQQGDIISVSNAPVNRPVLGSASEAVVQYLPLPAGLRDVRALRQSDLRGSYVMANGPRGADGCFPTWIFDLARAASTRVEPCLLAQANAQSPVNPVNESHILASFMGPASDQQNQVSSKVVLFNPAVPDPKPVDLPGPAALLGALPDGSLVALGGGAPYAIDPETGEVRELAAAPGAGLGPGAVLPGVRQIDLGDGLNVILSAPMGVGQGMTAVVVGDDANKPTRAKLALLGAGGAVSGTRDFSASWLPLVPPAPQQPQQGPMMMQPGIGGLRLPVFFDASTRSLFVLAAKGLVAFSGAQLEPKEVPFPEGWYAATCAPNVQIFNLELSRRIALFGAKRPHDELLAVCPAQGYLALDLASQAFTAVPLPGVGEVNTRAASGEVNDYLFASNTDAQNATLSDTLYIFDSVAGSPFRLDLPPGIVGFQQIVPVGPLNGLVATAIGTRVAGDGGLIFFDLENEKTTVFPVPEGFTTVQFVGVFTNTRKIAARGIKAGGTQYLIYDLLNGNLLMPPNPEGVAFAGPLPAAAGGGMGPQQPPQPQQQQVQAQLINVKSNTIAALAYDANRNPVGIMAIKVP